MAVSLTQITQEASGHRRMGSYTMTATYTPMQDQFTPFPQYSYIPPPVPTRPRISTQQLSRPAYYYDRSLSQADEQPPSPPPRPPKTPIEANDAPNPSLPPRKRADTLIEPDPLPPHSNPQALTQTQKEAFSDSSPIPPVRIGKEEVWDSKSGWALYVITRESGSVPNFLSSKPLVTVLKVDGRPLGNVRFHLSSNSIDLTVNGRSTSISHSGFVHNRWGFQSTTCTNTAEKWYWKEDKITGGAKLEDAKKGGRTLAKMKGDLLTFEESHLSHAAYDEVMLSAVALAEAARRQKRNGDIADLASAIGDLTSSASQHGDSGHHGT